MGKSIFVNLPVKDLNKSVAFFKSLGFSFNPQFTDETATCMIIEEGAIYSMLLTHAKFKEFTTKEIADTSRTAQMAIALGLDSRDAVDAMMKGALASGGVEPHPASDYGFMYQRTFEDLDGHVWEPMWMDPAHVQ